MDKNKDDTEIQAFKMYTKSKLIAGSQCQCVLKTKSIIDIPRQYF